MSKIDKGLLFLMLLVLVAIALAVPHVVPAQRVSKNAGLTKQLVQILSEPNAETEEVEIVEEAEEFIEIEATAYYDKFHAKCADGTKPYVGVLAGKREWLGKSVELYDHNMNYMGEYTFHDVGYGQSTGWGKSSLLKGMTVGTIEAGLCIDIYMETYAECMKYGRRKVFMKWSK